MPTSPSTDLRGLKGAQGKSGRDRPIAKGTAAARPAATLITPDSFYYATDTGILSYSDGSAWTTVTPGTGARVIRSGTAAGRSAAGSATNEFYYATDTGELSYSNGSVWVIVCAAEISARVYKASGATQSIPDVTFTALTFDAERFDPRGMHSTSSNTDRLTAPIAGRYLVTASAAFAISAAGTQRRLTIFVNNSFGVADVTCPVTANTLDHRLSVTTIWDAAVNDYFNAQVYQDSGGALNVTSVGGPLETEFMATLL